MKTIIRFLLMGLFTGVIHLPASPALGANLLIIDSQATEPYATIRLSLTRQLVQMGYHPGLNLTVRHWSIGNAEGRAVRAWRQEKDHPWDVIFVNGTMATKMFKQFAYGDSRYRFVFGAVTDPVGLGVIRSFEDYPTANFTGMCHPVRVRQRLEFILQCLPDACHIGYVYADMPQSRSYLEWLKQALAEEPFKHLRFHFRKVPFVKSEHGHLRMTQLAIEYIRELDGKVDAFISPNDQLGIQKSYSEMVYREASKPLVGLSRKDVVNDWGAAMSIHPDLKESGKQLAMMTVRIFEGEPVSAIRPRWPDVAYAFNLKKLKRFGISVPPALLKKAGPDISPDPP